MTRRKTVALAAAIAVAVIASVAAAWWFWWRMPALPEGILEGYGRIEATEITVAAKVPGRVAEVRVREGNAVRAGEMLVRISANEVGQRAVQAESRVEAAEAQLRMRDAEGKAKLEEADARLAGARERLQEARQQVDVLRHHLDKERADFQRDKELVVKGFISERQLNAAENRLKQADGALAQATKAAAAREADAEAARATRDGLTRQTPELLESLRQEAAVARALRGEVSVAQDELQVLAPSDATVLSRVTEPGEVVSPGTPLLVLGDLARPYMRVYLPERDVGKIKLGNAARVYVDSFPGRPFDAVVTEVANKAEFTPKDVHMPDERVTLVYAVKLEIGNPQGLVKPGMPADARIRWKPHARWED